MWRKKKVIVVAAVALVIILAGSIGGVAMAQTESNQTGKTLLARVASILGIDQQKVEDAFAQAKKEMQDEALSNRLKGLVESGKLSQEQADQYQQWYQSRPDVPPQLGPRGFQGFPGGFRGGFHGPKSFGRPPVSPSPSPTPSSS